MGCHALLQINKEILKRGEKKRKENPEGYFTCRMGRGPAYPLRRCRGSVGLSCSWPSAPGPPLPPPHVQLLTPFFTWGTAPHSHPGSLAYSARPGWASSDPLSAPRPSFRALSVRPPCLAPLHGAGTRHRAEGRASRSAGVSALESSLQAARPPGSSPRSGPPPHVQHQV